MESCYTCSLIGYANVALLHSYIIAFLAEVQISDVLGKNFNSLLQNFSGCPLLHRQCLIPPLCLACLPTRDPPRGGIEEAKCYSGNADLVLCDPDENATPTLG